MSLWVFQMRLTCKSSDWMKQIALIQCELTSSNPSTLKRTVDGVSEHLLSLCLTSVKLGHQSSPVFGLTLRLELHCWVSSLPTEDREASQPPLSCEQISHHLSLSFCTCILGGADLFTMLNLPICDRGMYLQFFGCSFIYFFIILYISECGSWTHFVKFVP